MVEIEDVQGGLDVQSGLIGPTSQCSVCGNAIPATPQKTTQADVVCKTCRCSYCGIPMSSKPCRCGVAHGMPSGTPGLCERCFVAAVRKPVAVPLEEELIDEEASEEDLIVEYSFASGVNDGGSTLGGGYA
jgi:hypothetical protein